MFETKEQVLETILAQDKPVCPHCNEEMKLWEVPPIPVGDGLGWDSPYLFVCFNDECKLYRDGWANMRDNYAHNASYRCIKSPIAASNNFELMPVFSPAGAQGQIIDDQVMAEQEALKESIKRGFSLLAECYVSKDSITVMRLLIDPTEPVRVRMKAAEMVGDMADVEAIDLLNNHRFGNELLANRVKEAVGKIHTRHFTRECPFCAEIIKKRANTCKHCGKEVAGE